MMIKGIAQFKQDICEQICTLYSLKYIIQNQRYENLHCRNVNDDVLKRYFTHTQIYTCLGNSKYIQQISMPLKIIPLNLWNKRKSNAYLSDLSPLTIYPDSNLTQTKYWVICSINIGQKRINCQSWIQKKLSRKFVAASIEINLFLKFLFIFATNSMQKSHFFMVVIY